MKTSGEAEFFLAGFAREGIWRLCRSPTHESRQLRRLIDFLLLSQGFTDVQRGENNAVEIIISRYAFEAVYQLEFAP